MAAKKSGGESAKERIARKRAEAAAWAMPKGLPPVKLRPNRAERIAIWQHTRDENAGSNDPALAKIDQDIAADRELRRQAMPPGASASAHLDGSTTSSGSWITARRERPSRERNLGWPCL